MRQRMQMVLERDLYALHHFRTSLEDVCRITASEEVCVLHLTDLHISSNNEKTILDLIQSNKSKLKVKNPELMVVTGDIVQGNSTAVDLEANYRSAANVLQKIAEILWPQPGIGNETMLRADWKKRIIIIPGNHDYASMNELAANHALRVTTGGVPVLRDGSPMSKFSYFIQFLQDFLGIDSRRSIQNNLNFLLEYPQMKLRFIALNSVAEVGPMRNNKVQLDKEFIKSLPENKQSDSEKHVNIALAHHSRCYVPDYFRDRYWDNALTDEACDIGKTIIRTCLKGKTEIEKLCVDAAKSGACVDSAILNEHVKRIKEEIQTLVENKSAEYKVLNENGEKTALCSDVAYVREHWFEITNERCTQIFTDYLRSTEMSDIDLFAYRERLSMLERKYKLAFMLGGHTHEAGQTKERAPNACVEGPRFYNSTAEDRTKLAYGRLLIKPNGECNYEFSHKKMGLPIEEAPKIQFENVWIQISEGSGET